MSNIISRNVSEDLVDLYLDDCIEKSGMCSCERCKADARALALNQLPAHYVVTTVGNAYIRANATSVQSQADIITAIMSGINVVRLSPKHDEK